MKTFLTFAAIVFAAASFTSANAQDNPFDYVVLGTAVVGVPISAGDRTGSSTEISLTQIQAALDADNAALAASLAADAIAADPSSADRVIAFVVSKNPNAAPALMAQVQAKAPGQATAAITAIGNALPNNAAGNAILAQAAANVAPAAGGNNANSTPVNLPAFIVTRIANATSTTNNNETPQEQPQQTNAGSAT